MRDIKRIKPFCEELERLWLRVPDWRFGQLISNFFGDVLASEGSVDLFFIEDDKLKEYIKKYMDIREDEPSPNKERKIKFQDFKKYLDTLRRHLDFKNIAYEAAEKADDFVTFDVPMMDSEVVDLLELLMEDEEDAIGYWVYDLNFGREYKDGDIKDDDGNIIPLKTEKDLWKYLTGETVNE